MPRNQFKRGTQSGGSVLGRCKHKTVTENVVVPDTDDAESDVVIIETPESSYWGSSCSRRKRISSRYVINIDDEDEGTGGGPSTTSYGNFRPTPTVQETTQVRFGSRNKRVLDYVSDSSASESLGSGFSDIGTPDAQDSDGDSSDCEILEDTSGSIREQWEQAALRRRMPRGVQFDSEDETSASSSSAVLGAQQHENMDNTPNAESGPDEIHFEQVGSEFLNAEGGSNTGFMHTEHVNSPEMAEQIFEKASCHNHQSQNTSFIHTKHVNPPETAEQIFEEASCHNHESHNTGFMPTTHVNPPEVAEQIFEQACHNRQSQQNFGSHGVANLEKGMPSVVQASCLSNGRDCSKQIEEDHLVEPIGTSYSANAGPDPSCSLTTVPQDQSLVASDPVDIPGKLAQSTTSEDSPNFQNGLVGAREKHKESVEYKRAEEEEWASRQKQLQIQAEEARRLRRKRKAESDMEKRQKQRLEEIRETQRKNEETINLKEQFRVQVRKELEQMERQHYSMGSLLRGLGITVEGGLRPLTSEVKAAYKRALLRFHPDRVSKTDIHEQVRAEETFKFISRLKEKLLF